MLRSSTAIFIFLLTLFALSQARYAPKSREEAGYKQMKVKRQPGDKYVIDVYSGREDGLTYYGMKLGDADKHSTYAQRDRRREAEALAD